MDWVLVAALADNGVIGQGGALPWHLPEDLRHFRALTLGHPVVMGRRTFEAIGRPLSGRRNIVLTRSAGPLPAGVEPASSLADAARIAGDGSTIMVIGGAEIYALALPVATRLELTRVPGEPAGDTRFPAVCWSDWRRTAVRCGSAESPPGLCFETWERAA